MYPNDIVGPPSFNPTNPRRRYQQSHLHPHTQLSDDHFFTIKKREYILIV